MIIFIERDSVSVCVCAQDCERCAKSTVLLNVVLDVLLQILIERDSVSVCLFDCGCVVCVCVRARKIVSGLLNRPVC